jgi:hypothetical protein
VTLVNGTVAKLASALREISQETTGCDYSSLSGCSIDPPLLVDSSSGSFFAGAHDFNMKNENTNFVHGTQINVNVEMKNAGRRLTQDLDAGRAGV